MIRKSWLQIERRVDGWKTASRCIGVGIEDACGRAVLRMKRNENGRKRKDGCIEVEIEKVEAV